MSVHLLDANLLIALLWPSHSSHGRAQRWFAQHAPQGWATCTLTQAAFVRIVSNPAFSSHAVSVRDAIQVLAASLRHPAHRFWIDHAGFLEVTAELHDRLTGHQQVTDAYLLGLALRQKGKLATLDRSIQSLAPAHFARQALVVI